MEMVEIYFTVLDYFYFFVTRIFESFCFYYLLKQFMPGVRRVWLTGTAYFFTMTLLYFIPVEIGNFTAYFTGVIAGFGTAYFLERRNVGQKLFLSVTFFSLRWLTRAVAGSFGELAYYYITQISTGWRLYILQGAEVLLDIGIGFLSLFFAVRIIVKMYVYKKESMSGRELLLLLIPSLPGVLGYAVHKYFQTAYETATGESIYEGYFGLLNILYYIVCFASILIIIVLFQNVKKTEAEERQNVFFQRELENIKEHIREVESLYNDIRGLRHDMGNHLLTLESLYQRQAYTEAESYMDKLKNQLFEKQADIRSGNPVTDVILEEKKRAAGEKGISFSCDFHYPEKTGIDAFDISIVLNNALTNALEAAALCRDPYIHIRSYRKKNIYMIEIKNSTSDEQPQQERGIRHLSTTKENLAEHGFGLSNIQRTAQKYFGDIYIEQKERCFILSIMFLVP